MTRPEQLARQQIDAMLHAAGWAVQDYAAYNPGAARGIALREAPLKSGRCDYLLIADRQPVGVVEAKRAGTLLVGFIGTAKGQHRLQDIFVDRTVTDGVLSIGHGLTDLEIGVMARQFKVFGNPDIPRLKKEPRNWWPFGIKKAPAPQVG